jgi:hypothetical protein
LEWFSKHTRPGVSKGWSYTVFGFGEDYEVAIGGVLLLEFISVGVNIDALFEIKILLLALIVIVIAAADDEDLANVGGLDEVGVVVGFVAFYNGGEAEDFERVGLALKDEFTFIFTI